VPASLNAASHSSAFAVAFSKVAPVVRCSEGEEEEQVEELCQVLTSST